MLRIILRNAASNWMGYAVATVVALFLTPVVLHGLGDARYAVWVLVTGLTGYYGLLDLGFRSGIGQYLTRHLATRDFARMNRAASTAFVALLCCGAVIALVSLLLSYLAPKVFTIPPEVISESKWAIVIIGLTVALQAVYSPISAVYIATQRYDLANAIGIVTRLATAAATFVAVKQGFGLVGLSLLNGVGELISCQVKRYLALRILPELWISPRLADWESLRPITSFSIWSVLNRAAGQMKTYSGGFIIGLFMPIAAVTPYALAAGFVARLLGGLAPVAMVFYPAVTHLDARGEKETLRQVYLAGSKLLLLLAVMGGLIGVAWAGDFFPLWLGREFVGDTKHGSVSSLFCVLVAGVILTTGQGVGCQVFWGTRRIHWLSGLLCCEATANVTLSVCLIGRYGLLGVAVGSLVPAVVFQGILHPVLICRIIGLPYWHYARQVLIPSATTGAIMACGLLGIRIAMPAPTTWAALMLCCLCSAVLGLALLALFGLNTSERERLFVRPFLRVRGALVACKLGEPRIGGELGDATSPENDPSFRHASD